MEMTFPVTGTSFRLSVGVPARIRVGTGNSTVSVSGPDMIETRIKGNNGIPCLMIRGRNRFSVMEESFIDLSLPDEELEDLTIEAVLGKVELDCLRTSQLTLKLCKGDILLRQGCQFSFLGINQKQGGLSAHLGPEARESQIRLNSGEVEVHAPGFEGEVLCKVFSGRIETDDCRMRAVKSELRLNGNDCGRVIDLELKQGTARLFRRSELGTPETKGGTHAYPATG